MTARPLDRLGLFVDAPHAGIPDRRKGSSISPGKPKNPRSCRIWRGSGAVTRKHPAQRMRDREAAGVQMKPPRSGHSGEVRRGLAIFRVPRIGVPIAAQWARS